MTLACSVNPSGPQRLAATAALFGRTVSTLLICLLLLAGYTRLPAQDLTSATDSPLGDDESIRSEIDSILAQPEFRRLRLQRPSTDTRESDFEFPQWLKDFWEWLSNLFGFQKALGGIAGAFMYLAWLVVGLICGLIVYLVAVAVLRYRRRYELAEGDGTSFAEGEAELPPGDLPADEYLRRAAELAAQGHYREAIGQLLLGAMSYAERSGLIRFRRGLTHRDYLRALRSRSQPHQAFRTLVGTYEPICFGRRPAQFEQYETSLNCYRSAFDEQI